MRSHWSWKFLLKSKNLLFLTETEVSDESEGDEEAVLEVVEGLYSDHGIDQTKENQTSEKSHQKEQADKSKAGKTITEETSETGTVSCVLWIVNFACHLIFLFAQQLNVIQVHAMINERSYIRTAVNDMTGRHIHYHHSYRNVSSCKKLKPEENKNNLRLERDSNQEDGS